MPGHTNAALASYAELNCNDVAPPLYTGIEVGFSTLCVDKEITYTFIDDVVNELAAITPDRTSTSAATRSSTDAGLHPVHGPRAGPSSQRTARQ